MHHPVVDVAQGLHGGELLPAEEVVVDVDGHEPAGAPGAAHGLDDVAEAEEGARPLVGQDVVVGLPGVDLDGPVQGHVQGGDGEQGVGVGVVERVPAVHVQYPVLLAHLQLGGGGFAIPGPEDDVTRLVRGGDVLADPAAGAQNLLGGVEIVALDLEPVLLKPVPFAVERGLGLVVGIPVEGVGVGVRGGLDVVHAHELSGQLQKLRASGQFRVHLGLDHRRGDREVVFCQYLIHDHLAAENGLVDLREAAEAVGVDVGDGDPQPAGRCRGQDRSVAQVHGPLQQGEGVQMPLASRRGRVPPVDESPGGQASGR